MDKCIVMASGNSGKIKEVQEILTEYQVVSMKDLGVNVDIDENQETFAKNAIKKAEDISRLLNGKLCIADDSGIEIEYLNGFPGVETKRWLKGTDRKRNLEILKKMNNVPKEKRKVKFVVAIAISDGKKTVCTEGVLEGYIAEEIRGENGFGFDEIFELENGKTLAELSEEEKNKISARRIALENIKESVIK